MKKNLWVRIFIAILFLGLSGSLMFSIYRFSSENGYESNNRSGIVTQVIKDQVEKRLETSETGMKLSEKIKAYVILYSPYGSDWNSNVRKLAHFSIYFLLACGIYITLWILGVKALPRFLLCVVFCFIFAFCDEYYQQFTGRTSSMNDVLLDSIGAICAGMMLSFISFIGWSIKKVIDSIHAYYE